VASITTFTFPNVDVASIMNFGFVRAKMEKIRSVRNVWKEPRRGFRVVTSVTFLRLTFQVFLKKTKKKHAV